MNIEIKPAPGFDAPTGEAVARATRGYFAEEIAAGELLPLLSSFSIEALQAARQAAPELARGWLVEEIPSDWAKKAKELDVVAIHCDHQPLTLELAREVKEAGYGLFCYTVNTRERASELLAWGVDGFCTDRIDIIPSMA
ncbi:Glycerophosphoryl diester phosphodiesterase [compost metagenome]